MFAGIIEKTGRVFRFEPAGSGGILVVHGGFDPATLSIGESIATNGVCLTVRAVDDRGFVADLSSETLLRTTLGSLRPGDLVNLERSLKVGDRISGHFVFGHVDTVGEIVELEPEGEGYRLRVRVPSDFAPFLIDKGSVSVDGISLTMCDCKSSSFDVAVVPHTFAVTNLSTRRPGEWVNLEADMLARYVRRALAVPA